MHNRILKITLFCAAFIVAPVLAFADDDLARRADWERPDAALVKPQIISWLDARDVEDALRQEVLAMWDDASGSLVGVALLERTVESFAKVDDRAREIFDKCQAPEGGLVPPKFEILGDEKVDAFVRNNLALYHARWLSQNRYYDESLVGIQELGPEDVVDPASLLFYQCVA